MPGLLMVYALGHKGSRTSTDLENLIQAGHGYEAHAGNVSSGHSVIDEAQQVTSDVIQDGADLPEVVTAKVPRVEQSVSHTWNSAEIKISHVIGQVIPDQHGWF